MGKDIIQRGAEAVIIKSGSNVIKRRVKKGYRLEEMDRKIRRGRTRREGRLLEKAGKLISVPEVLGVDDRKMEISMEFVDGLKLSEELDSLEGWEEVCERIGKNIGKLHDEGIIHGDLTTSNMIWVSGTRGESGVSAHPPALNHGGMSNRKKETRGGQLYFIDFGLGFGNGRIEDKAVDLHLIKQALEAKHFERWEKYWGEIVKGYGESEGSEKVLKQLEKVERRGRYKAQY